MTFPLDDHDVDVDVCQNCGGYYSGTSFAIRARLIEQGYIDETGKVLRTPVPQRCFACLEA